jgi:hypothetical protein
MKTEQEIVDGCNELARRFYMAMGYEVPAEYRMHDATHPQEVMCWEMAVTAYEFIEGTEVDHILQCLEDEA